LESPFFFCRRAPLCPNKKRCGLSRYCRRRRHLRASFHAEYCSARTFLGPLNSSRLRKLIRYTDSSSTNVLPVRDKRVHRFASIAMDTTPGVAFSLLVFSWSPRFHPFGTLRAQTPRKILLFPHRPNYKAAGVFLRREKIFLKKLLVLFRRSRAKLRTPLPCGSWHCCKIRFRALPIPKMFMFSREEHSSPPVPEELRQFLSLSEDLVVTPRAGRMLQLTAEVFFPLPADLFSGKRNHPLSDKKF